MDFEPVSVALKFAFLGVLYLFLFWIATSARRDLVRNRNGASGVAGFESQGSLGSTPEMRDAWLVVENCETIQRGTRFDLFGGITLGRSSEADVSFSDRYASGIHARVFSRGDHYFVEDLGSTNGTLLDGRPVSGEQPLGEGSLIEIGDTRFRIEVS